MATAISSLLTRARRWDGNTQSVDAFAQGGTPVADLRYNYDASDQRVIKEAVDEAGEKSYSLYVFPTLELRRTQFGAGFAEHSSTTVEDYEVSHLTVVPYLLANGVRLARIVYHGEDTVPEEPPSTDGGAGEVNASSGTLHVFFELGDHLGSTSVVLDKATGELVERATFQGYGGAESDYRPGRWNAFREDYRFTGKEEDVEVGLQYFGKRFLNPLLGRWISADPLAIHSPGEADLNLYAYVSGTVLKSIDPLGLDEEAVENEGGVAAQAEATGVDVASKENSYNDAEHVGISGDQGIELEDNRARPGFLKQLLGIAIAVGTLGIGLASKDVRGMIFGETSQKANASPATGYKTLEQAQTFRNMELAYLSERDGVEYSSATYQQGGRYHFTQPRQGTQDSSAPPQHTAIPDNAVMTDYAHSHPVTAGERAKGPTAGYDAKVHCQDIKSALDGFRELSSIHNVHQDYTETVVHRVRVESSSAAPSRSGDLVWTSSTLKVGEMIRSGSWQWNSHSSDVPDEMYDRR